MSVFKVTYTLTLGELDFEELSTSRFLIFVVYTTLITLILMNLLITILSDAYELVQSEKKFYDGKAKLKRSLMFERLAIFILGLFGREKEQTYHYLFISMPLSYEDDANNEEEGMIGKILNSARTNHKETEIRFENTSKKIEETQEKMDAKIEETQEKIKETQEKMNEKFDKMQ